MRSYQNMYEKEIADSLPLTDIVGTGRMLETTPACPAGGAYTAVGSIPVIGTAYLTCDYQAGTANAHAPKSTSGW